MATTVTIPELRRMYVEFHLRGVTPLLTNRFSEEKADAMEGVQTKEAKAKKAPRLPEEEFRGAMHRLENGGYGFPAVGLKSSIVKAGQRFADEKGTQLRGMLSIPVDMLEIEAPEPKMRRDRVVLAGISRTTSLAYRPEFWPWEMTVPVWFNAGFITLDQVVHLVSLAGFSVGIGAWRVENNGTHGQFEIADVRQVDR